MSKTSKLCFLLATVVGFSVQLQPASAEFPEKAIEFIIPFGAGGGADIEGRLLAKEMSKVCLLYTSPSPRDATLSRMPSSA